MAWPKGWSRSEVSRLSVKDKRRLFQGEHVDKPGPLMSSAEEVAEYTQIPEPVRQSAAPSTPKAPPRNLFSGTTLKLQVWGRDGNDKDPIPGYRLYWINDTEGGLRKAAAEASGWEFVKQEEVALNNAQLSPGNNDLGSNVRRWVGVGEDNKPIYAYLMKKTLELDAQHQQERENLHLQIEAALKSGTFNMTPGEKRYTAERPPIGSPSGLPPISISSSIAR
jgi:hypothetical protein